MADMIMHPSHGGALHTVGKLRIRDSFKLQKNGGILFREGICCGFQLFAKIFNIFRIFSISVINKIKCTGIPVRSVSGVLLRIKVAPDTVQDMAEF